jgi:hypothetical protein
VIQVTLVGRALAAAAIAIPVVAAPAAQANNGDTHITGIGITQTVDCNDSTLFVYGSNDNITAIGTCFAVTVQGSDNTVIADTVLNDVTVYGFNQTVLFHQGDPFIWDRGRELGMTNRIDRVPA